MSAQNASLGDATDVRDAGGDRAGGDRAGGDQADTAGADSAGADTAGMLRIGEVAKLTGLTTRTLRYWEEQGLLSPSDHRLSGERLYTPPDVARVIRIRDLQELLGFSLAEVRVVLDTDDVAVLDRVRSEFHGAHVSRDRRRQLLDEAIEANDQLLRRLDDTLARIRAFRDERADKAVTLRKHRDDL